MASNPNQGITRRDLLKKGAALGGAVVWVTPIVQSVGMGRAFASTPSPCTPGISYIAMNVKCFSTPRAECIDAPHPDNLYFIKWEDTNGFDGDWDPDPGSVPGCTGIFTPDGEKADGGCRGFRVDVDPSSGIATVVVGDDCEVLEGVVKGASLCSTLTDLMVSLPAENPFTVGCPTG